MKKSSNITFLQLISLLKKYKKKSIYSVSRKLIWDIFSQEKICPSIYTRILNTYIPKIIILSIANSNNLNNKLKVTFKRLYDISLNYIHISESISDHSFLVKEDIEITAALQSKGDIPEKYISSSYINGTAKHLFLARSVRQQFEMSQYSFNEILMVYDILTRLQNGSEVFNEKFIEIFGISVLHFMRSIVSIMSLAIKKRGMIDFDKITIEEGYEEKYGINIATCKNVALSLATDESSIKKWYADRVKTSNKYYQKYETYPLHKSAILAINSDNFLICSPSLYIRGSIEYILYKVQGKIDNLGDIIEDHIYYGLQNIFGNDSITKIPKNKSDPSADFKIEFDDFIIIVECKSSIGNHTNLSRLSPLIISQSWEKLYHASKQCSASVKEFVGCNKEILTVVLIAQNIFAESISYELFARRSGIYTDLGIDHIEFISWQDLQYYLSKTSIDNFVKVLIERKKNTDITVFQTLTFNIEEDKPAHEYQYLKKFDNEIFARIITENPESFK